MTPKQNSKYRLEFAKVALKRVNYDRFDIMAHEAVVIADAMLSELKQDKIAGIEFKRAVNQWGDKDGPFFRDLRDFVNEFVVMCAPPDSSAYKRGKEILDRIEKAEK